MSIIASRQWKIFNLYGHLRLVLTIAGVTCVAFLVNKRGTQVCKLKYMNAYKYHVYNRNQVIRRRMSAGKVRGGRRMDASYETDGEEVSPGNGKGRVRRNQSFRGNLSVDHAHQYDYKPIIDQFGNASLDRRDKPRNPWRKAVDGMRNVFRNISNSSPSLHRRSPGTSRREEPTGGSSHQQQPQRRTRSGSFSSQTSASNAVPVPSVNGPSRVRLTLPNGKHPGVFGIHNHGNTCFMNAVIQCLSNTDLLVEYLLNDDFRTGLSGAGQGCVLTRQFVSLIESLWTGSYRADISSAFKEIVGDIAEQYSGTAQNDAQEFLLWLLDKVNEELCSTQDKTVVLNNQPTESGLKGTNNNGSIINDLFQAKYRSTLTCPTCQRQSDTYDPFLSVSLPIQQKKRLPVSVTVHYLRPNFRPVLYGLMMSSLDTVVLLRRTLAKKAGIDEKQLLLTQVYDSTFQSTLLDSQSLFDLPNLDFIYGVEMFVTPDEMSTNGNSPDGQYAPTETICIVAMNRVCDITRRCRRFAGPFVVKVCRDVTMIQLRAAVLKGMRSMVIPGHLEQLVTGSWFQMRVITSYGDEVSLQDSHAFPLYAVTVDEALSLCTDDFSCPPHIKIVLEWQYRVYKSVLQNTHPEIMCDESYREIKEAGRPTDIADLQECFKAFTQQEQLGAEDTWLCPNCHKCQRGTMKSLNLSTLPDLMIIHLKRFKQEGENRTKLNTLIKFPISGLDMTCHMTQDQSSNNNKTERIKDDECIYDLYGVCNHDGNMSQGHYRAICKNSLSGQWYLFDDSNVKEVRETQIVTRHAYLLFYKRRQAPSRCVLALEECISRMLTNCGIITGNTTNFNHRREMAISKSVRSDRSQSNTRPSQPVRSATDHSISTTSRLKAPALSSNLPPTTNNSFHSSLRRPPVLKKTPIARLEMSPERAVAVSTPVMDRTTTMPHSKSQLLNKSVPVGSSSDSLLNGNVLEQRDDSADLIRLSDVSTVSSSHEPAVPIANRNKPKIIFEKVNGSSSNGTESQKQEKSGKSFGTWQQPLDKFIQESSV